MTTGKRESFSRKAYSRYFGRGFIYRSVGGSWIEVLILKFSSRGFKVFSESNVYSEYGIKLMLAPRSAKAKHSIEFAKVHGIRKFPGSPNGEHSLPKLNSLQYVQAAGENAMLPQIRREGLAKYNSAHVVEGDVLAFGGKAYKQAQREEMRGSLPWTWQLSKRLDDYDRSERSDKRHKSGDRYHPYNQQGSHKSHGQSDDRQRSDRQGSDRQNGGGYSGAGRDQRNRVPAYHGFQCSHRVTSEGYTHPRLQQMWDVDPGECRRAAEEARRFSRVFALNSGIRPAILQLVNLSYSMDCGRFLDTLSCHGYAVVSESQSFICSLYACTRLSVYRIEDQLQEIVGSEVLLDPSGSPWGAPVSVGHERMDSKRGISGSHCSEDRNHFGSRGRFMEGFSTISLPLTKLMGRGEWAERELNMRQRRWLEFLKGYGLKPFSAHPGKANVVADSLSRKSGYVSWYQSGREIISDLVSESSSRMTEKSGQLFRIFDQQTSFAFDDDGILWQVRTMMYHGSHKAQLLVGVCLNRRCASLCQKVFNLSAVRITPLVKLAEMFQQEIVRFHLPRTVLISDHADRRSTVSRLISGKGKSVRKLRDTSKKELSRSQASSERLSSSSGSDLAFLEEDGSTSFSASSASSSLSSWMIVVLAFGLIGGSYVLPLHVNTAFTCSFQVGGGRAQEAEARANVKLVEQHLLDEEVNKIVEGDDSTIDDFVDDMILSQEIPDTRIDPGSNMESPEAMKIDDYVATIEEEESVKATLIWKKVKSVTEASDTPIVTPRITIYSDKEQLQELTGLSRCYGHMMHTMKKTLIHKDNVRALLENVDNTLKEVVPKMVTTTTYGIMKENLPWLVVNVVKKERKHTKPDKYERSSAPLNTYRPEALQKRDHDDHPDDHTKGRRNQSTTSQALHNHKIYTIGFTHNPNHTITQDNYNRDLILRRREERSLNNNLFLGEYECSSLALDRDERRDEKKRLDHLKQDQTMLVIKRFSERKNVFRERKKTGKIHAKRFYVKFCGGEEDEKELVEMGEVGEGPFGKGEGGERGRKGIAMAGVDRDRNVEKEETGRI
ncbi:hypothetical protein Tco_1002609 [Tanacetum coccineum]|uniref:Uncharacterized protein n=1 Tax=Tanacetum coccineum TaxID=301880 RepID=A0ABQ5F6Q2_9ASTR